MDSRTRVDRMMKRQPHDRIPRFDGYWPETLERWRREGMQGDALDHLQADIAGVCWSWPMPFPGRREVVAEDSDTVTVINAMGNTVRESKTHSTPPEHVAFGCTTRDQWHEIYRPALIAAPPQFDASEVLGAASAGHQRKQWCCLRSIEAISGVHQLIGDETALIAEACEADWVIDIATVYTDLILRDFDAMLDAGVKVDGMWVFGDLAYNHGPFFSPAMYRDIFAPQHRRMGDWAHARGLPMVYHTDGDYRLLIDAMLDTGIDCLQPLEAKAGLDLAELVPVYGKRVSWMGNIDMTVASTNDLDALEAEVKAKLAAGMSQNGYAYYSDHSVPPDVSWQTYQHLIKLLDRYGNYDS